MLYPGLADAIIRITSAFKQIIIHLPRTQGFLGWPLNLADLIQSGEAEEVRYVPVHISVL